MDLAQLYRAIPDAMQEFLKKAGFSLLFSKVTEEGKYLVARLSIGETILAWIPLQSELPAKLAFQLNASPEDVFSASLQLRIQNNAKLRMKLEAVKGNLREFGCEVEEVPEEGRLLIRIAPDRLTSAAAARCLSWIREYNQVASDVVMSDILQEIEEETA